MAVSVSSIRLISKALSNYIILLEKSLVYLFYPCIYTEWYKVFICALCVSSFVFPPPTYRFFYRIYNKVLVKLKVSQVRRVTTYQKASYLDHSYPGRLSFTS